MKSTKDTKKVLASSQITIIDLNDQISLYSSLDSTSSTVQALSSTNGYIPSWSTTPVTVTPSLYKLGVSENLISSSYVTSIKWFVKLGISTVWTELTSSTSQYELVGTSPKITSLKIKTNVMTKAQPSLAIKCEMTYKEGWMPEAFVQKGEISYSLSVQGEDGSDGSDGVNAYTVLLSNETHSVACDFLGNPGVGEIGAASSKAKSTITAKLGNVELTPIGESEALGKGKFKYKINNTLSSGTCLGERANNNTFYLKEIYEDSGELIVDVYLESDSNKYTKQFSWSKVLDGEDARYVGLVGQSYFHYDNPQDTTSTPVEIKLEGILYNQLQGTAKWQYKPSKDNVWKDIVSQAGSLISGNTLTMNDKVLFGLNDPVTDIKFIVTDSVTNIEYYAIKSVTKVYDGKPGEPGTPGSPGEDGKPGKDSYTMLLTNESHTILCDKDYVPKPGEINSATCKAKSDIIVKKGTESLTVVGESATPTVGQWMYKIEPAPVNCTAARASNTSFYLTSISGDSGKVSITLYVEGVVASNKFVKEFTWSRVIEGSNAPYIKIEGEQFFKYDNKSDTTPTPVEIALTVNSYNINTPSFVWQYYSGGWKAIDSAPGSVIANNVLTINDKKLFGSNNSVRIRCYTTNLGETINDTVTIAKVYDGNDGNDGAPGDPSKTVKITGKNTIKYKNGSANPTSIVLTATPTNYKTKAFKWYRLDGSSFTQITTGINTTGNQLTVTANTMADTELYKVECRETNGSDLSFDEFQVTKVYDGGDGNSYVVNITEGTRNICYNGKNNLVSTQITPFKLEVFKNNVNVVGTVAIKSITWSAKGHYTTPAAAGNTSFQPTPITTYDESKLDTSVSVVVNCEGRIIKASVPVTVSKNSTAIDWVEEWDNSKVEIGGEYIISPKIFAGKKNTQSNTITGIALGRDIINNSDEVGLAIYSNNNIIGKILSTPTSDGKMVIFGGKAGSQVYIKTDGSVCIEGGITVSSKTLIEVVKDSEKGSQANDKIDNLEIGGRNFLINSTFIKNGTNTSLGWDQKLNGTYTATHWDFYNAGVSDPTTGYHAHLFLLNDELVVRYMEQANRWKSATYNIPEGVRSQIDKGITYTYSFEIYSDTVGSKIFGGFYYTKIGGTTTNFHNGQYSFTVKEVNKWIRYSYTFTMPKDMDLTKNVSIYNYGEQSKGTTYARRFMLEKGNKAGDHKESHEDTEQKVNDQILGVHDAIASMKSENVKATEELLAKELEKYMETGDFNEFYKTYSTKQTQDSNSFSYLFNQVDVNIKESIDGLTATTSEIQKYISFVDGDILLGNTKSPFTLKITNEKIQFLDGGNEIAYISNQKLFITDAHVTNSLQIGSFKWIPRSNGNTSFTWVG